MVKESACSIKSNASSLSSESLENPIIFFDPLMLYEFRNRMKVSCNVSFVFVDGWRIIVRPCFFSPA